MKRALLVAGSTLALLAVVVWSFGATIVDRVANRALSDPPYTANEAATELYRDLFTVDLHADPLLWDRDLTERLSYGAIDLPRLIEGNVAIQAFFIVSKSPWTQNIDRTPADSDAITTLITLQRWPDETRDSLLQRALYQASKLDALVDSSGGDMVILRNRSDLVRYREARGEGGAKVAAILGVEGAHVLEGELANVQRLFDAGVRIVAPTHFFDNDIGGSAHGVDKHGLTPLGKAMVRELETRGMLLDLAHASAAVIDDALAMVTRPVIVSHTGLRGTCDNNRNLTDAQAQAIARTGGVIGIGYWPTAVCGENATAIAEAIAYAVDLVGREHVALGSDFDGAVPVPFDTTGLARIVEALLARGMSPSDIRAVMGENAVRVLLETLPE